MSISVVDKHQLLLRAGYRCEYCKCDIMSREWEAEHINPRSANGSTLLSNLAVSCGRCNRNKSNRTHAADPVTRKIVKLFNPRRQQWTSHFKSTPGGVVGITPVGRASAAVLFRLTSQVVPPDLNWDVIRDLDDEPLYRFLNHQRGIRLANRFSDLEKTLQVTAAPRRVSTADLEIADFATTILLAETYFTRSTEADVKRGLRFISRALERFSKCPDQIAKLKHIQSILFQQQATILFIRGERKSALRHQAESHKAFVAYLNLSSSPSLGEHLRETTLATKLIGLDDPIRDVNRRRLRIGEVKLGEPSALTYLADAELALRKPSRHLDNILADLETDISTSGYGQDLDYARTTVNRRRWWALRAFGRHRCNLDLLQKDVEFWKSIGMQNEVRELLFLLRRVKAKVKKGAIDEMVHIVESPIR